MNISQINSQMSSSETNAASNIENNHSVSDLTNPSMLLKQQAWVMQYSTMVGFQSAMIKTVKDILSGIIQKI